MADRLTETMRPAQIQSARCAPHRFAVLCVLLLGGTWLFTVYQWISLPDVSALRYTPPHSTRLMRTYDGPVQYHWTPLVRISPLLGRAVIAAEDDQFLIHQGFDWTAIQRAARINWRRGRFAFGASTITQQVAKNLYLTASKNPLRKLKEFLIALVLERDLTKDEILELYLNIAEWGPGVFGAEAAAQHYFRRHAAQLTAPQAAFLASILPNPKRLGARGFRLTPRALMILRMM